MRNLHVFDVCPSTPSPSAMTLRTKLTSINGNQAPTKFNVKSKQRRQNHSKDVRILKIIESAEVKVFVSRKPANNLGWYGWVSYEKLPAHWCIDTPNVMGQKRRYRGRPDNKSATSEPLMVPWEKKTRSLQKVSFSNFIAKHILRPMLWACFNDLDSH